jgi:hypothetical protein
MRPFLRKNILNNAAALFSIFKSTNEAKKQFSRFEQNDFFYANMFTTNNYNNTQHNKLFNKHLLSLQK